MEDCGYCKEKETKMRNYEEEIQNEKLRECQRALEREKIAKGMQCTKKDELQLRAMQMMQMQEKKYIEWEEEERDRMWHEILLDDVRRKEQKEREEFNRRQQEMLETRMVYDEQIASANRKRQEAIRAEREKENRRLEKMMKKMEQDHYDAIKRKKDQQMVNKKNFIEGHEIKLSILRNQKMKDREIDNNTISVALQKLREERQRERMQMKSLQIEKKIFTENYNRERQIAIELEENADRIAQEWRKEEQNKIDEHIREVEEEKRRSKQIAAQEYKRHIEERNQELEKDKQMRNERMERVKRTAYHELQRRLDSANGELKKQIDYRKCLTDQLRNNQKVLENELCSIEDKQRPFTKKAEMFKDVMANKFRKSPGRISTNPVHPFKKIIEAKEKIDGTVHLPSITKYV